ncbi:MAG: hypothetical protein LAO30_08650 [Acidobacteriia bacterium]|nr:hypothetical protein [Terriglobia bacterium]
MDAALWCDAEVHIPFVYFRWIWFLVLTTLVALGILTFNARHAGTWLLVLLFLSIPIRVIWGILIPPWIERGAFKAGLPFIAWYVTLCAFQIAYSLFWGWLHVGLGASKAELNENWDFFSIPLCWISSAFLVRSDKWLSDVIGIIVGNTFFEALGMFAVYTGVRARLNRNRAIRLNITDIEPRDEQ